MWLSKKKIAFINMAILVFMFIEVSISFLMKKNIFKP